jgi:hypothetical protein
MKWTLWLGLAVLVLTVLVLMIKPKKSCYAPPRDENTEMPYVDKVNDVQESQTEVFKDAAGWLNMREHPMSGFIQEDAFANVASVTGFGDFVGLESSAGIAPMTVIPTDEQYEYLKSSTTATEYGQSITSQQTPPIGGVV